MTAVESFKKRINEFKSFEMTDIEEIRSFFEELLKEMPKDIENIETKEAVNYLVTELPFVFEHIKKVNSEKIKLVKIENINSVHSFYKNEENSLSEAPEEQNVSVRIGDFDLNELNKMLLPVGYSLLKQRDQYIHYCRELNSLLEELIQPITILSQKLIEQEKRLKTDKEFIDSLLIKEERDKAFIRLLTKHEDFLKRENILRQERTDFLKNELTNILLKCGLNNASLENIKSDDLVSAAVGLFPPMSKELEILVKDLEKISPFLADELKKKMFVFEDIVLLTDWDIANVLKVVDTYVLATALIGTVFEIQEKFFNNMSNRAVDLIRSDMEFLEPILKFHVRNSQTKIIMIIRKLEEQGDITFPANVDETF